MQVKDVVKRLNKELPFKITRSKVHFYQKINLILASEVEDNNYRNYSEKDYVELRTAILLSRAGISLVDIDRLLNKKEKNANRDILKRLDTTAKVVRTLRKILK